MPLDHYTIWETAIYCKPIDAWCILNTTTGTLYGEFKTEQEAFADIKHGTIRADLPVRRVSLIEINEALSMRYLKEGIPPSLRVMPERILISNYVHQKSASVAMRTIIEWLNKRRAVYKKRPPSTVFSAPDYWDMPCRLKTAAEHLTPIELRFIQQNTFYWHTAP